MNFCFCCFYFVIRMGISGHKYQDEEINTMKCVVFIILCPQ